MTKTVVLLLILGGLVQDMRAQEFPVSVRSKFDQRDKLEQVVGEAIRRGLYQSGATTEVASSGDKSIRIVYLVPADKSENPAYTQALADAITHAQSWYRDQLGLDKSFRLNTPVVEVHNTPHDADWYSTNPNGELIVQFWLNVLEDGFSLTEGMFDDPDNQWIYYIDAPTVCGQYGGAGTNGVVVINANDLLGLIGQPEIPACPEHDFEYPKCRYVGGLAHELGHGLGLPHPPGCDEGMPTCDYEALMWLGYLSYPDTYLREDEKTHLNDSPFFESFDITNQPRDCPDIGLPLTPTNLAPSDGNEGLELPVALHWTNQPEVEHYRIQVSTDTSFSFLLGSRSNTSQAVFDSTGVTDTTIVVPDLELGTKYFWHVQGQNQAGAGQFSRLSTFSTTTGVSTEPPTRIKAFTLHQNYPNPFRGSTTVSFTMERAARVSITVYDSFGRHVEQLMSQTRPPGRSEVVFEAGHLADGVYFVRIETDDFSAIRSMTLLK